MKDDVKEVAETMSDYAKAEKENLVKNIRNISIVGLAALKVYIILGRTGADDKNDLFRILFGSSEALIYVAEVMFKI